MPAMAGALLLASCSAHVKSSGGLELIIASDGLSAPADFDDVRLEISQQTSSGSWNLVFSQDYRVPQDTTLPTTFAIAAGTSPHEEALIRATAFDGAGQPVVLREVQVGVPTDRVAELWLVLARACAGQVACGAGESCQPDTGACGSEVVDVSTLPTYVAGDENGEAGGDGAVVEGGDAGGGDGAVVEGGDAGGGESGLEGGDGGTAEWADADATLDAPGDLTVDALVDGSRDASIANIDAALSVEAGDSGVDSASAKDASPPVTDASMGDACRSIPEDCTNGIDDNCDGKIDCADPECQSEGFVCATTYGGWFGPVVLLDEDGGTSASSTSCPASSLTNPASPDYGTLVFDGHRTPDYPPAACACTCGAALDAGCPGATMEAFSDPDCGTSMSPPLTVVGCFNPNIGGASSVRITAPDEQAAACDAGATKSAPPWSWSDSQRACGPTRILAHGAVRRLPCWAGLRRSASDAPIHRRLVSLPDGRSIMLESGRVPAQARFG